MEELHTLFVEPKKPDLYILWLFRWRQGTYKNESMETEIIVFTFERDRESMRELSRPNTHHTHIYSQNFIEKMITLTPKSNKLIKQSNTSMHQPKCLK